MKLMGAYKNGNYTVKIFSDGTKIRETEADDFIALFPENMDVKITNQCDMGCAYCFPEKTQILMSNFTYKNIEDVVIGDKVLGYDEIAPTKGKRRSLKITTVLNTFCHIENNFVKIESDSGNKITSTPNHPFLSSGNDRRTYFKNAEKLNNSNYLYEIPLDYNSSIDYESKQYKLGYLIGAFTGDGHVGQCIDCNGYNMYTCRFVTNDDDINQRVHNYISEFTNVFYQLDFKMKNGDIKKSVRSGKCSSYEFMINLYNENLFQNNNADYCAGYLGGIYDSEGHIDKKKHNIRITNTNIDYIKETERCLNAFNIPYVREFIERSKSGQNLKNIYNVRIIGNLNWCKFLHYSNPICNYKTLAHNIIGKGLYNKTKIISKTTFEKEQKVYNFETDIHTYIANNYLVHNCHENSTIDGLHGDILNPKFLDTLHPFTEIAIGGGNPLAHPDLIEFLHRLKDKKIIANVTVNQIHFEKSQDLIKDLVNAELINGLGVSLVNTTTEFVEKIKQYPNAVIHVINGILKESDIETLKNNDLKMLILGYKHFRRGNSYYDNCSANIKNNQDWLYKNLAEIVSQFKVVSFDNLAIEQLEVKRIMTDENWNEFYMGDDGNFTMYIDLVEQKFARCSVSNIRYDLQDNIQDMFAIIKSEVRG